MLQRMFVKNNKTIAAYKQKIIKNKNTMIYSPKILNKKVTGESIVLKI